MRLHLVRADGDTLLVELLPSPGIAPTLVRHDGVLYAWGRIHHAGRATCHVYGESIPVELDGCRVIGTDPDR